MCGLCLSQKTVQKRSSSFAKTTVFPDHHEEPILLKVEILFLLLVKPLKTNSKKSSLAPAQTGTPPNRVRSEFRRGQTPKQLDSAATAVMTLAVAATTAAALWIHRNSSRTAGTRTSSPGCPPAKEGGGGSGAGGGNSVLPIRWGHPRCRRSGSSTFRAPFSP